MPKAQPTKFGTIAIIGVGLIGGSIGLSLKQRGLARRVIGIGRSRQSLDLARRLGAIDSSSLHISRAVTDANIVIVCTSVRLIAEKVNEVSQYCQTQTLITDVGSTKQTITEQLRERNPGDKGTFIGSHPLAGSEKRGIRAARPDLLDQRLVVVTPTARDSKRATKTIQAFWKQLGARTKVMSPEAHDQALAFTSHLPHLIAAGLVNATPHQYLELAASGFLDTTRIAASDPELWSDIFLENQSRLLESLDQYESTITEFKAALRSRDRSKLVKLWKKSQKQRKAISK